MRSHAKAWLEFARRRSFNETSTNLVNWTLLRELPSAGALTEFTDAEAATQPRRFYRAVLR